MEPVLRGKFELLSRRLQALLDEKVALKEEIRYYQAENRELKASLARTKSEGKNFPEPSEKPNIAKENGSYAEKVASIAKQIDVYVEEIDRCIAQLED
jgi:hypothetical protein